MKLFIVGTAFLKPEQDEPEEGRLLAFAMNNNQLEIVAEINIAGCPYASAYFKDDMIVSTVGNKIIIYRLSSFQFTEVTRKFGQILPLFLKIENNFIVIGDLMKSLNVLEFKDNMLYEYGRDYHSSWITALESWSHNVHIAAENYNNLIVTSKLEASFIGDIPRLEVTASFHLGEFINKMVKGSLINDASASTKPFQDTLVYGTVSGALGIILSLDKQLFLDLKKLENSLEDVVHGVGGFNHEL